MHPIGCNCYMCTTYGPSDPGDEMAEQIANDIIAEVDGDLDLAIRVVEKTKYILDSMNGRRPQRANDSPFHIVEYQETAYRYVTDPRYGSIVPAFGIGPEMKDGGQ